MPRAHRSNAQCARCALLALLIAGYGLVADPAAAQLRDDGEPIDTSNYTIDLHQGPVTGGSRNIALAGTWGPLAPGVLGYGYNPASVAQRVPWSTGWFDWEIDGGFTLPSSVTSLDYDNNGDDSYANSAAFFANAGLGFQFGEVGVGANVDWQLYQLDSLDPAGEAQELNVSVLRTTLVLGYAFLNGELIGGIGVSATNVQIDRQVAFGSGEEAAIASVTGPALHLGALWAPAYIPLRIGAGVRLAAPAAWTPESVPTCAPPSCQQIDNDFISEGYYLPRTISLPTEVRLSAAVQLFRPLNIPWVNPRKERSYKNMLKADITRARKRRKQIQQEAIAAVAKRGGDVGREKKLLKKHEEAIYDEEEELLDEADELDHQRRQMLYKALPRERLLILAGMKLTFNAIHGVGLESFLEQTVERSGEAITVQPQLAAESEVIPGYVVLRAGGYLEPTRFRNGSARLHGTTGLDIRIPIEWSVFGLLEDDNTFRVGGAIDGSARYFSWGVTAGIWR